jgi:hypothetical protein
VPACASEAAALRILAFSVGRVWMPWPGQGPRDRLGATAKTKKVTKVSFSSGGTANGNQTQNSKAGIPYSMRNWHGNTVIGKHPPGAPQRGAGALTARPSRLSEALHRSLQGLFRMIKFNYPGYSPRGYRCYYYLLHSLFHPTSLGRLWVRRVTTRRSRSTGVANPTPRQNEPQGEVPDP